MKYLIFMLMLVVLAGTGCNTNSQQSNSTPTTSQWVVEGDNLESIALTVAPWVTTTFSQEGVAVGADDAHAIRFKGDLKVVASHEARVIDIPKGRSVGDYGEPIEPTNFFVYVLEDEDGQIFRAFVQSFDGETFKVTTFGPALNRDNGLELASWPSPELQREAERGQAELVMIPYPYPMNQVYYQYGTDISAARLVSAETGISHNGLTALLDSIESDWNSLR